MRRRLWLAAVVGAAAAPGCADPCCTFDSRPIRLERAAGGALLTTIAEGEGPDGELRPAVVDTATPITLWDVPGHTGTPEARERTLRLLGASEERQPTRAVFRRAMTVEGVLGPVGAPQEPTRPRALVGGDLLVGYSVEFGFRAPEVRFWARQPATDAFLAAAGYAVLRSKRRGGGELEARAPSDGIGPRGPYQYPPTQLVLRACAAPAPFSREAPLPATCCPGEERRLASGTDLALVIGTGVGPLVLGRSAWQRVSAQIGEARPTRRGPLLVATAREPIDAEWTTLPRLALVDREAEVSADPGPCVELARARRLEQVAFRHAHAPGSAACALPCDRDPRAPDKAQNSAAYIELGGDIEVAVVEDREPFLQTLRHEIRPEGPEVAGLLGAGALRDARVELDYRGQPARAIFSCEPDAPPERCRALGRCPRLPGPGQVRACFGLPPHGLPGMCDNLPTSCD